jgi:tripartite-type tricarboxylate transporter receptor subunit TctC
MNSRSALATCLVVSVLVGAAVPGALAAEGFPNHTMKIVVPVPPGPLLDVIPRMIAQKLSAKWGVAY